jgi:protein required for attachment to host cells
VRVRIVVADRSEARFYDMTRSDGPLRPSGRMANAAAHLHERDLVSDRPGRVFDRAARAHTRREASAHHATGGERTARRQEALGFARRVARRLGVDLRQDRFDRIVLMAGPASLGLLRAAFPDPIRRHIACEVRKDLVHVDEAAIRAHVPGEAFQIRSANG